MSNIATAELIDTLDKFEDLKSELERRQRIERFRKDPLWGAKYYFPHRFTKPYSKFHFDIVEPFLKVAELNSDYKVNILAPRGFAKSEFFSFLLPMFCLAFNLKKFIPLISDTYGQAVGLLLSIREELETNDKWINDFGDMTTSVWSTEKLVAGTSGKKKRTPEQIEEMDALYGGLPEDENDDEIDGKLLRLHLKNTDTLILPLGTRQRIRGRKYKQYRPDMAILDDPDNDENVMTPAQREKSWRWFNDALLEAGSQDGFSMVVVGTALHQECLVLKISKELRRFETLRYKALISFPDRMDLWEIFRQEMFTRENPRAYLDAVAYYESNKAEMDAGSALLWGEYHTLLKLMSKYFEDKTGFMKEKQNEPRDERTQIYDSKTFARFNLVRLLNSDIKFVKLFIGLDPAVGTDKTEYKKPEGSFPAIVVVAQDEHGYIYILDAWGNRCTPTEQERKYLEICEHWCFRETFKDCIKEGLVESIAFQKYFKNKIRSKAKEMQIPIKIRGNRVDTNKLLRIATLEPEVTNKLVRFADSIPQEYFDQFDQFPSGSYFDFPDITQQVVNRMIKRSGIMVSGGSSEENKDKAGMKKSGRVGLNADSLPCEGEHPLKGKNLPHERLTRIATFCSSNQCSSCPLGKKDK